MDKATKAKAILSGRAKLRRFLDAARQHGTLYHATRYSKEGGSAYVALYTIAPGDTGPMLVKLWPSCDGDSLRGSYSEAVGWVAKDWGFSCEKRAIVRRGGGTEATFEAVEGLACLAGMPDPLEYVNAVRRESL